MSRGWLSIVLVALLGTGCTQVRVVDLRAADPRLDELAWLAGGWVAEPGHGVRVEEHWTHGAGGSMLGVNRTISEGRTAAFEFLRIDVGPDGTIVYHASPGGRDPATPFTLVRGRPDVLVFENLGHDFPRRIIYRRTADGWLDVRIEGVQGGVAATSSWRMRPARIARP